MVENPLQGTSIDRENSSLMSGLTMQPRIGEPPNQGVDFSKVVENAQKWDAYDRLKGNKQYRESPVEAQLRKEAEARRWEQNRIADAAREAEIQRRQQTQREYLQRQAQQPPPTPSPIQRNPLEENLTKQPSRIPTSETTRPSTGSPAPTLQQTSARRSPNIDPTAPPRQAIPAEAVGAAGATAIAATKTIPKGLPIPAGLVQTNAILGAANFGAQVVMGRNPIDAAISSSGSTVGSIAGGAIGAAVFGPPGMLIGSVIGGAIGGQVAENILGISKPTNAELPQQPFTSPPIIPGGQLACVQYNVTCVPVYKNGTSGTSKTETYFGPITGTRIIDNGYYGQVLSGGKVGVGACNPAGNVANFYHFTDFGSNLAGMRITSITRVDGLPDTTYAQMPVAPAPQDSRPYQYQHPREVDYNIGTGRPSQQKAPTNYLTPGKPAGGTPRGDGDDWIPHGGPAPRRNPNPTTTPSNLGHNLPLMEPIAVPNNIWNPDGVDPTTPGLGGLLQNPLVENQARSRNSASTYDGSGSSFVEIDAEGNLRISSPSGVPQPRQQTVSPPDGQKVVPPAFQTFSPEPTSNDPNVENIKKTQDDLSKQITELGGLIGSIIPLLGGIPANIANDPGFQKKNKETIQGAVCEISQPDGCLGSPIKKAEDAANNNSNKLDQLNAALNGLDLANNAGINNKLDIINNKLGDQLPGGIGGKLDRVAKWLHLDRLLNLLTFAATVHNGVQLSSDILVTLGSALSNVLQIIGIKDDSGSPVDIGQLINSSVENIVKGIVGAENYQKLSVVWEKTNRIYQASTNVLNRLMDANAVITNALEVIGGYTGKIGNALRIWGVVGEKAYNWMNPQPSFDNKWVTKLQQLQDGANTVQMVSQIPIDATNAVTELTNASTEFIKTIKQEPDTKDGIDVGEAAKVKAEREASKNVSIPLEFDITDLFDADE